MLKIGKGLKKKKKSKKHKKEEELFKPEELEQYRREHQQREAEAAELAEQNAEEASTTKVATDNDEWKKFNALTSGIDSVLKKTQSDLDRIKSTSFFKKVPPPKPTPPPKPEPQEAHKPVEEEKSDVEEQLPQFLEVESESEYEEEEDIFDTSYVDVVASGEVKLAYVPDSPIEEEGQDDFDPFDTSAADKIIRGPEVSKKGKKIVSIGSAVEVLTGRIESVSTCAIGRKSPRRIQGNTDLLLDPEVDTNGNLTEISIVTPVVEEKVQKSLLDDDDPPPIDEPIDLSVSLVHKKLEEKNETNSEENKPVLDLKEFDVLTTQNATEEPDELDDEFASLAAESLKTVKPQLDLGQIKTQVQPVEVETTWDAFGNEANETTVQQGERKLSSVSIHITDPSGFREALNDDKEQSNLTVTQKDLLGSSTTDLSTLGESIAPTEVEEELTYKDPFDTSVVEQINVPGKAELRFIEEEFLGDTKSELKHSLSDPDFDPRKDEEQEVQQPTTTDFDIPEDEVDPFDTSFIATVVPGKAELKLIESELAQLEDKVTSPPNKLQDILSNTDKLSKTVSPPKDLPLAVEKETTDLLFVEENVDIKALTPAVEKPVASEFDISYSDPFDTSVAGNILPGKAELKLLENELLTIQAPVTVKPAKETIEKVLPTAFAPPAQTVQQTQIEDLLSDITDNTIELKALTPEKERSPTEADDYDPFDTSITTTLGPGKVELKLLESELIQ